VTAIKQRVAREHGRRRSDVGLDDFGLGMLSRVGSWGLSPEELSSDWVRYESPELDERLPVDFSLGCILILDDTESAVAVARKSLRALLSVVTHSGKRSLQTSRATLCKGPGTPAAYRKPTATPQRI
jgi:hypothetical protein